MVSPPPGRPQGCHTDVGAARHEHAGDDGHEANNTPRTRPRHRALQPQRRRGLATHARPTVEPLSQALWRERGTPGSDGSTPASANI